MTTERWPNSPKVLVLELRERTSARGTRYLAGWMGKARLVAFADEPDETGHRVWSVSRASRSRTGMRSGTAADEQAHPPAAVRMGDACPFPGS